MTWTKLHELCGRKTATPSSTEAILMQAMLHPEEVAFVDDRCFTPLHVAVVRDDPNEIEIEALLQANPDAVMMKDLHGSTPLHLALWPGVSPNIIRLLIDERPGVVYEKDKEGLMPMHAACRYCPDNEEVIRMLIDANPSALHSRTKMGNLVQKKPGVSPSLRPIELVQHNQHLVLDGTTSSAWKESQIKSTVERRFEERTLLQVRDHSYPLHMAISSGAPMQVLDMLVKEAPEVASKTDKFGRTCLHLAVKNGGTTTNDIIDGPEPYTEEKHSLSTMEAVKLIHLLDTSQVKTKDKAEKLPLHTACEVGCIVDVAKFLVHAYPDSVHTKNKDGNLPVDVAAAFGHCSKGLINYLSELSVTDDDVEVSQ